MRSKKDHAAFGACKNHREHDMGYVEFFEYSDRQHANGVDQVQCMACGLFIWPEHWNKDALKKQLENKGT